MAIFLCIERDYDDQIIHLATTDPIMALTYKSDHPGIDVFAYRDAGKFPYKSYDVEKLCKIITDKSSENRRGCFTAYLSSSDDGYKIEHHEQYGQFPICIAIATAANGKLTYLAPWAGKEAFPVADENLSDFFWGYE